MRIHSICEDYSCVFRQTATIARTSELVISESDLVTGNWSLFLVHKHSVVIGIRTEKIVLKDACGDLYKMKWLAVDSYRWLHPCAIKMYIVSQDD